MMKAVSPSEMLLYFYQTVGHHIPEDGYLQEGKN
jgi:hypothetical protein